MDNESGVSASKKMRRDLSREKDELWNTAREQLVDKVIRQQQEIEALQAKQFSDNSLDELRETVEKMKLQVAESNRQENLLMMRLAAKDREVQELISQISDLKQAMNPSSAQLQSMLLDPAINLLFVQMKREMENSRTQLEQSQKDLAAWKFTPDSQTGKRLMAKCRMLLQENEELGRTVSSGRLAKLEGDIALQKRLIAEMKNSEKDTEEFLGDVDEDLEAMQGTVYLLQQELKDAKERISAQQLEIEQLREAATAFRGPSSTSAECAGGAATERKSQAVESSDTATAERRDSKTVAIVDARVRPNQNCGQATNASEDKHTAKTLSPSEQRRQSASKTSPSSASSKNPEKMDVDSVDEFGAGDERRSGKQNCLNASRTSSSVVSVGHEVNAVNRDDATSPSADDSLTSTVEEGHHRTAGGLDSCRTAAATGKLGSVVERDCGLPNGMDDDDRRTAVTD